jgi:ankyrin repeat protein
LLLEHKADVHAVDRQQSTVLITAARVCKTEEKGPKDFARSFTAELLAFFLQGPHATPEWINARDKSGSTALSTAIVRQSAACVAPLVEANADVNLIPQHDLDNFAKRGFLLYGNGIMKTLVDAGADVSVFAAANQMMLDTAVYNRDDDLLSTLLRANPLPNVNKQNDDGKTLLFQLLHVSSRATLEMMLDAGADPTISDDSGDIPLFHAGSGAVRLLLEAAPHSINYVDAAGRNAVMRACLESSQRYRVFLGQLHGLDTSITDGNGDTVLHIAMSRRLKGVVTELLQLPINVFSTNSNGFTALMKALGDPLRVPVPVLARRNGATAAEEDREISACLALVADHVLGMSATHGCTRKAGAAGDGDGDGGDGETEEAVAKRRRV